MDSRLFGGYGGVGFRFLPRCCFLRGRSPAYPFFRKEKIHPHRRRRDCDAESPERVLLRSGLSMWGGGFVRRTESPSQGYRLTAVVEGFSREHRVPLTRTYRSEDLAQFVQKPQCGAGSTPHAGGNQTLCVVEGRKSAQTQPPLFPPLKKMGIQGGPGPHAPLAAHLRIRRSRIPRCVVKRRTAETRDSVSRPCPLTHAEGSNPFILIDRKIRLTLQADYPMIIANSTVSRPDTPMAILLIAPSASPSSSALEVPTA